MNIVCNKQANVRILYVSTSCGKLCSYLCGDFDFQLRSGDGEMWRCPHIRPRGFPCKGTHILWKTCAQEELGRIQCANPHALQRRQGQCFLVNHYPVDWSIWEACVRKGLMKVRQRQKQLVVRHQAPAWSCDQTCAHDLCCVDSIGSVTGGAGNYDVNTHTTFFSLAKDEWAWPPLNTSVNKDWGQQGKQWFGSFWMEMSAN